MSTGISGARRVIGVCDAFDVTGKTAGMPRGGGERRGRGLTAGRPRLLLVWSAPGQRGEAAASRPSAPLPGAGVRPSAQRAGAAASSPAEPAGDGAPSATRPASAALRRPIAPRPAGLRLTRRGRAVLAAVLTLAVIATVTVMRTSAAGGSEPSARGASARSPYSSMTQVAVRPGQTLWSVAAAAEPSANAWAVVQEIIDVNRLSSPQIQPGQLLWVPKA